MECHDPEMNIGHFQAKGRMPILQHVTVRGSHKGNIILKHVYQFILDVPYFCNI